MPSVCQKSRWESRLWEVRRPAITTLVNSSLNAELLGWNRARISDLAASFDCGLQRVHISLPVSEVQIAAKFGGDRQRLWQQLEESLTFARDRSQFISVGAEDASRADPEFLLAVAKTAQRLGAQRFRFCDTLGILDPFQMMEQVQPLVDSLDIPVEVHTHDDLGMATANALAGLRAGAKVVDVTVNGIGERAETRPSKKSLLPCVAFRIGTLALIVVNCYNSPKPFNSSLIPASSPWKAIVGENVFTHESGIHADGILKNPQTYEPFPPNGWEPSIRSESANIPGDGRSPPV